MNAETLARITKEAEEKYRLFRINFEILEFGDEHSEYSKEYAKLEYNVKQESKIEGYIAGATAEAERSEKLREDIESISEYIDVCGDDYDPGELLIKIQHKINSALNNNL